jgi:hypothetical protein
MAPCNRASDDDPTTFSEEDSNNNVEVESDFTVDAAVADIAFDTESDGNFIDDVSMNTETETVDAAVADTAEEEDNYDDLAMVDAAVADASFETETADNFADDDQNFVDAAVAGESASAVNTQQQKTQSEASTGMQGWMVAIIVMFSITTVLLLAVIVLAVTVLRRKLN